MARLGTLYKLGAKYYSLDGRRIANASRAAYGLNIVQLPNGIMVKNMNIIRHR